MATELSKDDTPEKQNLKLDCKCSRSVIALFQIIENYFSNVLDSQHENKCVGTDIFQTYRRLMMSNILIKGEAVSQEDAVLDTTTEFEPFDAEKEKYIHGLLERFDGQIVSTTRLRKSASKQVRRKVKSLIRPELKYTALVSVDTQSEKHDAMETDTTNPAGSVSVEEIEERMQRSEDKCSYNKQFCGDMLQKARDLSQAMQIYKQSEKSEIVKAMYETPPNTPVAKNGLDKHLETTRKISKKLLP